MSKITKESNMPIYEYVCEDCLKCFSLKRSIDDRDEKCDCPDCGSENTKREISSGTSFTLNGNGWYKDGYSKGGESEHNT